MTEPQVQALFNQIADGEPGPTRVDTHLALRRGRARLRWRRAGVAGAPLLAAATVVAVVLTVAAGPVRPGASPVASGGGPAAPRQFDPLNPVMSFGWLPAGQVFQSGGVGPTGAFASVYAETAGSPLGWSVTAYARGQCRLTGQASGLKCANRVTNDPLSARFSARAPDVNGHRAYWVVTYGLSLVWEYARDGWAQLFTTADSLSALRHEKMLGDAVRTARHLQVGAGTPPLLFPAQFTGLGSQWRVSDVDYVPVAGVLGAESYMLATSTSRYYPHVGDLGIWSNAPTIVIQRSRNSCRATAKDTTETINGYRVVLERRTVGGHRMQELCVAHADGFWLTIIMLGPHPTIGVVSLFKHMRLLGTNPAHWTRHPIR